MTEHDGAETRDLVPAGLREQYRQQILDSIGGWSGSIVAAIPTVVFVVVDTFAALIWAVVAAVGCAALLTAYRVWRRQPVQQALFGLAGVVTAAAVAFYTGHAKGYFLIGIWGSFIYGGLFVASLLVRRPVVGLVWEFLDPTPGDEGFVWHRSRPLLRAYDLATLLASLIFLARGVVQQSLFHENRTGWLAFARLAMGYPLYVLALGFGFWIVRRARTRLAADSAVAVQTAQAAQTD